MKNNQLYKRLLLLGLLCTIPGMSLTACGSDQRTYTIGIVNLIPNLDLVVEGFKEGMTDLGYIEGENITYIYEGAAGSIDKLDPVAQDLVAADVDLILSITTPATQAAQRATSGADIPVVFVPVTDPVGAGIVDSLRNPGGNITGVTFGAQEARRLEWLTRVAPTIEQVYIPYNPEDQSTILALKTVSEAATTLGIELLLREIDTPEEIAAAIEDIPEEADAIYFLPDSLVGTHASEFAKLQLPTSIADPSTMKALDMLTSFGMEFNAAGKQAARLADQIFRGIRPAELPVETAEFYLAINMKVAEAIGLDIPDDILLQADIIVR